MRACENNEFRFFFSERQKQMTTNSFWCRCALYAVIGYASTTADTWAETMIDFEGLPGSGFFVGSAVVEESRLARQYEDMGVLFRSGSKDYAAVVRLGNRHATSGENGICGVTDDDKVTYAGEYPIVARFCMPSDPTFLATTDYVSVRLDMACTSWETVYLKAYGPTGTLIDLASIQDTSGGTLSLSAQGIHEVHLIGSGSSAFDDFAFGNLSLAGDLNSDGTIGTPDLDIIRCHWGETVPGGDLLMGDPSGDGVVGDADLSVIRANWGAPVPEPGTLILLIMGIAYAAIRLRRR